jgi:hypothetical protein
VSANDTVYGKDDFNSTARSIKFYSETLGLQLGGPPGEVTLFHAGSTRIALNHPLGNAAVLNPKGDHGDMHRGRLCLCQNRASHNTSEQGSYHAFDMTESSLDLLPNLANFLRTSDGFSPN